MAFFSEGQIIRISLNLIWPGGGSPYQKIKFCLESQFFGSDSSRAELRWSFIAINGRFIVFYGKMSLCLAVIDQIHLVLFVFEGNEGIYRRDRPGTRQLSRKTKKNKL